MASVLAFCYTEAQPVDILKIATFNTALLEWLEREGPDVVCLQELKAPDAAFPINDIHAADPVRLPEPAGSSDLERQPLAPPSVCRTVRASQVPKPRLQSRSPPLRKQ
jgi:hypothetical protein